MNKLLCVRCNQKKLASEFVNDRTRVRGKFPWCKSCVIERRRETKAEDRKRELRPASVGERTCLGCLRSLEGMHANRHFCSAPCKDRVRRWRIFGLEPDEYRALIAANEGCCPICRRSVKRWTVDHNHTTGEVTGVTCSVCNQSLLAYSRHEPEVARRLLDYLSDPPLRKVLGEPRFVGPDGLDQFARAEGWRRRRGPYSVGLAQSSHFEEAA